MCVVCTHSKEEAEEGVEEEVLEIDVDVEVEVEVDLESEEAEHPTNIKHRLAA